MIDLVNRLYAITDKGPFRALSLVFALLLSGCIFWQADRFTSDSLASWQLVILIWATCTGFIHGVGFCPQNIVWKTLFLPLPAILVLALGLIYFWFY